MENIEDILFCLWRISKISYKNHGEYRRYPISTMENKEDLDFIDFSI